MQYQLDNRDIEVVDTEIEIGEYAAIIDARFSDTGIDLNEDELERLNQRYEVEIYEECYSHAAARAYDRAKDARKYGED